MGGTNSDTGRFEALVNAVDTIIAFDHFSGFRVPLGRSPGACRYARFAADAKRSVYKHNTVFRPLLHGPGWTSGHTPGIFTVKTGHKRIGGPGKTTNKGRADGNDFTELGSYWQILVALASNFTAMATDAFLCILE